MTELLLFWEFFKAGLFSIGGGLATLPFLYDISARTGWFSSADIGNMIAISESTPGALGINMATYAGYTTGGTAGGIVATLGLIAPSIIVIIIIARLLEKFKRSAIVEKAFYGLRPASIALIAAVGINVAETAIVNMDAVAAGAFGGMISWKALILGAAIFFAEKKTKWHPVVFIAIAAAVGIIFRFGA